MDVVILAGGQGSRLSKVFTGPKCLVPIHGRPLLTHLVDYLKLQGAGRVLVAAGYLGDEVRQYVRRNFDQSVEVTIEGTPLGTGGAIVALLPQLPSEFVIVNGDTLVEGRLQDLWQYHVTARAPVTLGIVKGWGKDYGQVSVGTLPGTVTRFCEKPTTQDDADPYFSAGVYAVRREAFQGLAVTPTSLERDIVPKLVRAGQVHGYALDAVADVGTAERWQEVLRRWQVVTALPRA